LILGITTILMYYPFGEWFATSYSSVQWWQGLRTPLGDYLTVHGLFLFIIVSYLVWDSFPWLKEFALLWYSHPFAWLAFDRKSSFRLASFVGALLALTWLWFADLQVFVLVVPLIAWIVIRLIQRDQPAIKRLLLVFFAITLLITLMVEVIVLTGDVGRSNMVFYFYIQVWAFFSVAASAAMVLLLEHSRRWARGWRWSWLAALTILVFAAVSYPLTATPARLADRWPDVINPPRTLDGMAYMLGDGAVSGDPSASAIYNDDNRLFSLATDYAGMRAMQAGVSGTPTIVEGQTEEYRWGSRYSIYTGLPTVVGWSWHVRQHNSLMDGAIVEKRIAEVKDFYTTTDLNSALSFLRRYQVKYIILGDLERGYYPGDGLNKFAEMVRTGTINEFFKKDLGSSHLVIYKVGNVQ
ncbi:MAG: DUF2298 domain-containing protein, partial [Anaerolineaceae bacterium]|nr:DUF2298 domain-containing protein [Anaerolineaceae bacterium]